MHKFSISSMVAAGLVTLMMSTVLPEPVWATGDRPESVQSERFEYDLTKRARMEGDRSKSASVNEQVNGHLSGYYNRTGFDLLTGGSGTGIRLQMVNGYQFNERFSAGIGIGYVFYHDPVDLVPVYADMVYQLRDDGFIPFLYLKAGFSVGILRDDFRIADRHGGGPLLNPGFGILFSGKSEPGIYLTTGFNLDNSYIEREAFGDRVIKDSISYRRISLGFGLLF